jgi:hypothetical protein
MNENNAIQIQLYCAASSGFLDDTARVPARSIRNKSHRGSPYGHVRTRRWPTLQQTHSDIHCCRSPEALVDCEYLLHWNSLLEYYYCWVTKQGSLVQIKLDAALREGATRGFFLPDDTYRRGQRPRPRPQRPPTRITSGMESSRKQSSRNS